MPALLATSLAPPGSAGISGPPHPGYNEGYYNNTCILAQAGAPYLSIGSACSLTNLTTITVTTGNNAVYAPDGTTTVTACGKTMSFAQWLAVGSDSGTTLTPAIPPSSQIIAWARQLLNS